jgi:hypothetical protein
LVKNRPIGSSGIATAIGLPNIPRCAARQGDCLVSLTVCPGGGEQRNQKATRDANYELIGPCAQQWRCQPVKARARDGVAECRVRGDVVDLLAVEIDGASVPKRLDVICAGLALHW